MIRYLARRATWPEALALLSPLRLIATNLLGWGGTRVRLGGVWPENAWLGPGSPAGIDLGHVTLDGRRRDC